MAKRGCLKGLLLAESIVPLPGIPILEYHRVSPNIGPHDVHSISPEEFAWQMEWLKTKGYKVIGLDELMVRQNEKSKGRYVAITFDDGHRDILSYAAPILRQHGARATVFVLTDYVGRTGWLQADGTFKEGSSGVQQWSLLNWDELRSSADVFDVGVHGKTHRPLTSLTEMEISQDLSEARALITREIGVRPTFYCYPYGSADARTISAVSKLGFAGACGTEKGLNCGGRDRFCMRRNEVGRGLEETHFSLLVTEYALWYSRIGRWARA